jgi:hypothetical protein
MTVASGKGQAILTSDTAVLGIVILANHQPIWFNVLFTLICMP